MPPKSFNVHPRIDQSTSEEKKSQKVDLFPINYVFNKFFSCFTERLTTATFLMFISIFPMQKEGTQVYVRVN